MRSYKTQADDHTPGPWELRQSTRGHMGDSYYFLDHVQGGEGYSHVRFQPDEVSDADARLIAAAPDLLAALYNMVALQEVVAAPYKSMAADEAISNGRAAIARATSLSQGGSKKMSHNNLGHEYSCQYSAEFPVDQWDRPGGLYSLADVPVAAHKILTREGVVFAQNEDGTKFHVRDDAENFTRWVPADAVTPAEK